MISTWLTSRAPLGRSSPSDDGERATCSSCGQALCFNTDNLGRMLEWCSDSRCRNSTPHSQTPDLTPCRAKRTIGAYLRIKAAVDALPDDEIS